MLRHAWKYWGGEQFDQEDGQHHLASVAWMAFAMMELEETHPDLDDRPRAVELDSELLNPEEIEEAKREVKTFEVDNLNRLLEIPLGQGQSGDSGSPSP